VAFRRQMVKVDSLRWVNSKISTLW